MDAITSAGQMQELLKYSRIQANDERQMTPKQLELRRACNDFEAVLTTKMLKEGMQTAKGLGGSEDEEGDSGSETFKELANEQIATFIGRQGMLGLGDMLYNATKNRIKDTGDGK